MPGLVQRKPGIRDDEDSDDESDDEDEGPTKADIFSPRRTRSGKQFHQEGEPPRKKKKKLKKNRSAMRRKARIKKLKALLNQRLDDKVDQRRREEHRKKQDLAQKAREHLHNLAFQQIATDQKRDYDVEDARLMAQMMQQIGEKMKTPDGVAFI